MNKIPIKKTYNFGENINGSCLILLMKNYVKSINEGIIPEIENTWSLICNEQFRKAFEIANQNFVDFVQLEISNKIPMNAKILEVNFFFFIILIEELFK